MDAYEISRSYKELFQRSQRYFEGLRELPQWGGQHLMPFFQKAFESFLMLWKYQQENRAVLESREGYGLKRWEIGEIASKIGQLFYFHYLRSSDLQSLEHAFVFYDAIAARQYFKVTATGAEAARQLQKKLRYHARFVVVCLLTNRRALVKQLCDELNALVEEYTPLAGTDATEWATVVDELTTLIRAERLAFLDTPADPADLASPKLQVGVSYRILPECGLDTAYTKCLHNRLASDPAAPEPTTLRLSDVVIVHNRKLQVKFSELSLDILRIAQSLEWEPGNARRATPSSPRGDGMGGVAESGIRYLRLTPSTPNNNPRKSLLYRPSYAQLMFVLSTAVMEMELRPSSGARECLMVYISADGQGTGGGGEGVQLAPPTPPLTFHAPPAGVQAPIPVAAPLQHAGADPESRSPASDGGNPLNSPRSVANGAKPKEARQRDRDGLYWMDLRPFSRLPLFLIVDSDNSRDFSPRENEFGLPLVCLMSPTVYPADFTDPTQQGSLFTQFLTQPVLAFWYIMRKTAVPAAAFDAAAALVHSAFAELLALLLSANLHPSFEAFLTDEFTRLYILRFVLCKAVLQSTPPFNANPLHIPACYPPLPEDVFGAGCLRKLIADVTAMAQAPATA